MFQFFGPLYQPIMTFLGVGFSAPPPDIGVAPQTDTVTFQPGVPFIEPPPAPYIGAPPFPVY